MKRYRITLEGRTFDVRVLDDPRLEEVRVEVDGETLRVRVEEPAAEQVAATGDPVSAAAPPPVDEATPSASSGVSAPLPGVIKSIAVRPGQRVSTNDELLVIEAMKMDNTVRASRAGTIGAVLVTEGRQVAYGTLLLEYKD